MIIRLWPLQVQDGFLGINLIKKNGLIIRNKAKLITKGYNQEEGIDYDKTFAYVARLETIRILLAFILCKKF